MAGNATEGGDRGPATGGDRGFDPAGRLDGLAARGLRRDLAPTETIAGRARVAPDPRGDPPAFADDERLILSSNNYLGLAGDDRLADAAARAAREVGTGAGASRLLAGDTPVHRALERSLAVAKDAERALVFPSGYVANVGTITALDPDVVFSDELNHASIIDGCRLSGAEIEVYPHCDPDGLAAAMAARAEEADPGESWLVVTDTVFSMDGDVAPLGAICDRAERHGAWVMVDEAHATGLYEDGAGIVGREGLADRIHVQLGTLSKALGAQGGYVAGSEPLVEYLLNAARGFVFSTGLAPPAAAAAGRGLELARESDARERLWRNVERLREGLTSMGYEVRGQTQILPVVVGDRERALALDERLADRGIVAPAIRPPTVPEGTSRIRVAPTATHAPGEIDACLAAFETAGSDLGLL